MAGSSVNIDRWPDCTAGTGIGHAAEMFAVEAAGRRFIVVTAACPRPPERGRTARCV
ncbi:MAG: hypothetical protein IID42_08805 [Planctomycetes bacterium]|nr:hypothetical protein [Planctomycetota bacterium]